MSFNTYGQRKKTFGAEVQVWAEVKGVKHGGGTIEGFASLPTGFTIPAGTPVHLGKSGGTLVPIYFYELAEDVAATDTEVTLYGNAPLPATGNIAVAPSTIGGEVTGVAYTGGVDNGDGTHTITITANALGVLEAGAVLGEATESGAKKALKEDAIPDGLLWHDIIKEEGDTMATGSVVDVGRIFYDRIVAIPDAYLDVLSSIKFERNI